MRRVAICVFAVVLAALARADQPVDIPCVTWTPGQQNVVPPNVDQLFVADVGCIECDPWSNSGSSGSSGAGECVEYTNIYPCFAGSTNTWGHRDGRGNLPSDFSACHTQVGDQVIFAENMFLPQKGAQWQTWHWQLTQRGAQVPDNAIRYGQSVMAKSINNGPGTCIGAGYTGWAVGKPDGTFGDVYFTTGENPAETNEFQVAICKAYKPTPAPTPIPPPPSPGPTTTPAPTPPPTTQAPPTLPPNDKPYIRFGNAIAADNEVTATITQGNVSYTWTGYPFAQFSPWNELFTNGEGTLTIYQQLGSTTGPLLLTKVIPLTPGPLVVVVKGAWPPTNTLTSVETIAASYIPVPEPDTSGVRLFNLIDDLPEAGMSDQSGVLVNDIPYTLGSGWYPIPVEQLSFSIFNSKTNKTLTSFSTTPPTPPYVFTAFLLGMANHTGQYGPRAVPLIDAPEALYRAAGLVPTRK